MGEGRKRKAVVTQRRIQEKSANPNLKSFPENAEEPRQEGGAENQRGVKDG